MRDTLNQSSPHQDPSRGPGESYGLARPLAPAILGAKLRRVRAPLAVGAAFLAFGCAVVANAMVMQPSRHPAPLFAAPARAAMRQAPPLPPERPIIQASTRSTEVDPVADHAAAERANAKAAARTLDTGAIGAMPARGLEKPATPDKGAPDKGLVLVQQALGKAGYGPPKADGMLGRETRASIERFERERRWPVTGEPSQKLLRELGLARQPRS